MNEDFRSMAIAMLKTIATQENWTRKQRHCVLNMLARQPFHTMAAEFAALSDRWMERRDRMHLTNDELFAERSGWLAVKQSQRTACGHARCTACACGEK